LHTVLSSALVRDEGLGTTEGAMTTKTGSQKRVVDVRGTTERHWVGDGFPVRTLFSYDDSGEELSPFLLLDYGGPANFPPTTARRGVGEHPHRGFETVTIVFSGEVEHRDSSGGGGRIGPGDVQWMTAGSGLVHEEFHGREWAKKGGEFHMVQLWVNLPAKDKMTAPRYQGILDAQIPVVALDGGGRARVIAGELAGTKGPAKTFSPVNVWDLRLDGTTRLEVSEGFTAAVVVLQGRVRVNGAKAADSGSVVLLDREGTEVGLESEGPAMALLLSGKPLGEPISGYGPFVMNTDQEIRQAIVDFQSGKMGRLA
jgi:redox-sensitive bicupin YhaK (pirin superfamily)